MTDVLTPEERHRNMTAIRSRNTKPELFIRRLLFSRGYRYRLAPHNIPGHPDMFLRRWNTAIFVHGCFWHRHAGCRYTTVPATRSEFWMKKFLNNTHRDALVAEELLSSGIRRLVIWECTIKNMMKKKSLQEDILKNIETFLHGNELNIEF